jgi:MFS family permease
MKGGADVAADIERTATYREVFAVTEYRAVFGAYILSMVGDMLAKVAVAVLVFDETGSPLLSAAAFAIGYLPWVAGGPFLAALADRLPWRRTLVLCDLGRMVLVALLAVPWIPLPVLLIVLFAAALLSPPFEAARSAMLPDILDGDRYVLGLAMNNIAAQLSQVVGFVFGGAVVALISARGALLLDAATFLGSALLLRLWVASRPAPNPADKRSSLRKETLAGLRLVFGTRTLRIYTIMVWASAAFAFAPEGLAAPFAKDLGGGPATVGLLLAANPVGTVIGGVVIGRLLSPSRRVRVLRPLALLSTAALVPLAVELPLWAVLLLYAASGFGMSFLLPLNAIFVRALPTSFRARAFGLVQSGLQVSQGIAVVVAGWAASVITTRYVIGLSGILGLVVVLALAAIWPSEQESAPAVRKAA